MKTRKENIKRYYQQKNMSLIEIVLVILTLVSVFVMMFVTGGIPIGLPIVGVCLISIVFIRSNKIHDSEIDKIIGCIIEENKIDVSENTIECYDFNGKNIKKRKDGRLISSDYYITNILFLSDGKIVFHVYYIDIITQNLCEKMYTVNDRKEVSLFEEQILLLGKLQKVYYLKIDNSDTFIPVILSDYRISTLIKQICYNYEKI